MWGWGEVNRMHTQLFVVFLSVLCCLSTPLEAELKGKVIRLNSFELEKTYCSILR